MKTGKHFNGAAVLAITALVFSACFSDWQPESAVITLRLGGPDGRAVARAAEELAQRPEFKVYYKVQLSGPSGEQTLTTEQGAQTAQITVVPGAWDITLEAYTDDHELYATGSVKGFPVKAGQSNTVAIDMYPADDGATNPVPVSGVILDKETLTLIGGASETLTATVHLRTLPTRP